MRYGTVNDKLAAELARYGLRATRQRVAALRLLRRQRGHPTAIELHRLLLRDHPTLSQKTVYETLDAFVTVGLASRVTEGGEPYRYEVWAEPHYHARCRACNRLYDLPASGDSQIRGRTPLPDGFHVENIQVTIHGLCLRCRDQT